MPNTSRPTANLRTKLTDSVKSSLEVGAPPSRRPAPGLFARLARLVHGAYALALLAVLVTLAALLALLLPRLGWRRASTRALARVWLAGIGLRISALGADGLPGGHCVLVANHSSYLDGVILQAVLPPRFSFVVKREAASLPLVGLLLRRIGAEFVEREAKGRRQRDARRVVRRAEAGHSLVFFPEGTFDKQVGVKRFKIGAFVAAARGNVPVVPVAIHGARRSLPPGTILPRPARLLVEVLAPVGAHGEAAEQLRDAARGAIVARLGEPDLAREAVA